MLKRPKTVVGPRAVKFDKEVTSESLTGTTFAGSPLVQNLMIRPESTHKRTKSSMNQKRLMATAIYNQPLVAPHRRDISRP